VDCFVINRMITCGPKHYCRWKFESYLLPAYSAQTKLRRSNGAGRYGGLMTKKLSLHLNIFVVFIVTFSMLSGLAMADNIPLMTKEELKTHLGDDDISILDVRAGRDWKSSEFKITGAQRVAPAANNQWADQFNKDKTYVFYCA